MTPTYTDTYSNVEPLKVIKYVTLTDSETGEQVSGCFETQESMRARLAWSKNAGPNVFRSLGLWLVQQGVK